MTVVFLGGGFDIINLPNLPTVAKPHFHSQHSVVHSVKSKNSKLNYIYYRPQTKFRARYPQGQVPPPEPGTPPGSRYIPQSRYTPRTRYTPQDQVPPPPDQVHPWDQVHPQDQVHPKDQVHPFPKDQVHPQDQVHPPDQVPPRTRYSPRDQVPHLHRTPHERLYTQVHLPPPTPTLWEPCMLRDTDNKRAVCILLECILVAQYFGTNLVLKS